MIIWQGWGLLVILAYIVAVWITNSMVMPLLPDSEWLGEDANLWVSALVAGAICFWLGGFLKRRPRRIKDPVSGDVVEINRTDTLFFVPIRLWSILYVGLALMMFSATLD